MLPAVDVEGRLTGRLAFLYAAALLPVTAALSVWGVTGGAFLLASQLVGLGFLWLGWAFLRIRNQQTARRLFLASIIYLPAVMGLMVADMGTAAPTETAATIAASDATPQPALGEAPTRSDSGAS
jgi:protoheme IX farnesyltransferase